MKPYISCHPILLLQLSSPPPPASHTPTDFSHARLDMFQLYLNYMKLEGILHKECEIYNNVQGEIVFKDLLCYHQGYICPIPKNFGVEFLFSSEQGSITNLSCSFSLLFTRIKDNSLYTRYINGWCVKQLPATRIKGINPIVQFCVCNSKYEYGYQLSGPTPQLLRLLAENVKLTQDQEGGLFHFPLNLET